MINVEGGDQRERFSASALMLQIPALKIGAWTLFAMKKLHIDSPLWKVPGKLMRRSPFPYILAETTMKMYDRAGPLFNATHQDT